MSRHAGPPDPEERNGAAVATIAVVGLLGVIVSLLAIFRPDTDAGPSGAADIAPASQQPSSVTQSAPTSPRTIHKAKPTRKPQKVGKVGDALRKKTQEVVEREPTTFRVSTFNVLGASHTKPGGNKRGWAPATTRMAWAISILRANDVDVVGLQEFESSQFGSFMAQTDGAWGVYPGLSADPEAVRNSIAWRRDTWELVEGRTIPIPYFRGNRIPMPYVRLRNIESGQDVYFINVHNPATTGRWGNNERWRDVATGIEVGLVQQLHAAGFPVVLTGDFNERDEVFCKVTGSGAMRAANGGSLGGACAPPPAMGVDWIFGSATMEFSGFQAQRTGLVQRATDHPFVVADATIPPPDDPPGDG
jgi:endonuclease/exonuclease/phosphatase family metal-dependent hydrolase